MERTTSTDASVKRLPTARYSRPCNGMDDRVGYSRPTIPVWSSCEWNRKASRRFIISWLFLECHFDVVILPPPSRRGANYFYACCLRPWLGPSLSYVLPVLWMTSCFYIMPYVEIEYDNSRDSNQILLNSKDQKHSLWVAHREQSLLSTFSLLATVMLAFITARRYASAVYAVGFRHRNYTQLIRNWF